MISFADYGKHDATGLAALVRRREVSVAELVEAAFTRLEAVNPTLNAVIRPLPERARAQAADPALPDGPFRGVPFVLKDLESDLAGVPKSSASRFYGEWAPSATGALAERWLEAGVIVLGKSNCPELGLVPTTEPERWGPTRNPWDRSRTPGGSSGGTAAAVASGIVPFGSGGDGGGSIRIPASCCGLFGLKPTRGRTPVGPGQAEAWHGCAIQHVLTRSVRDSAAMLDATCGWQPGDRDYLPPPERPFAGEVGRDPGRLRIAVTTAPFLPGTVHPDCVAATGEAADLLRKLGHDVAEDAPHIDGAAFAQAFLVMLGGNTWAAVREAEQAVGRTARPRDFEALTWLSRQLGAAFHAGHYVEAVRRLHALARPVHTFFERYDALLCPTLAEPPPRLGFMKKPGLMGLAETLLSRLPPTPLHRTERLLEEASRDAFAFVPFTPVTNVTGQPSASLPLHWNERGLPVGVMVTAAFAREDVIFRLAGQLEAERPWAHRLPVGGGEP